MPFYLLVDTYHRFDKYVKNIYHKMSVSYSANAILTAELVHCNSGVDL